jgi:hypothetical protein
MGFMGLVATSSGNKSTFIQGYLPMSFIWVRIHPNFTLLDECQNADKREKPDAFYPFEFTN